MHVQAPVIGSLAMTVSSESDSFPEPAIELCNMACAEDVLKEQPLTVTGYSSNENLDDDDDDDDCQADENDEI